MEIYLKIFNLLSPKEKKKSVIITTLIFFVTIFEIFGISMLIPIVSALVNENYIINLKNNYLVFSDLNLITVKYIIIISFFIFIVIKNFYYYYAMKYIYFFIFKNEHHVAMGILKSYMSQNYSFFVKNNSSYLVHNITQEVWKFNDILLNCFFLATEALIASSILLIFLYINPIATTIVIASLLISFFIFVSFYKKKLIYYGGQRQFHERQRIKLVNEIFVGIKDIIIRGAESLFLKNFNANYNNILIPRMYQSVLRAVPKIGTEIFIVTIFSGILVFFANKTIDLNSSLPQIVFTAACILRLLPSTNKIFYSVQVINFGKTTVDLLTSHINMYNINNPIHITEEKKIQKILFKDKIKFKNISFSYGDKKILEDLNFEIRKNTLTAITGKSGSGKSTLVSILMGLIKQNNGSIYADTTEINTDPGKVNSWRSSIGYVPQSIFVLDNTLKKNIALGFEDSEIDDKKINKAIQNSKVSEFINDLPNGVDSRIGSAGINISSGQLQRIGLARALYNEPDLLILDEATSTLNIELEKDIFKTLLDLKSKMTVVVITHRESNLSYCDDIFKIDQKKIFKI